MKWADVDVTQHKGSSAKQYSKICKETVEDGFLIYSFLFTELVAEPHKFVDDPSVPDQHISNRVRAWWAKTIVEHRFAEVCPATQ